MADRSVSVRLLADVRGFVAGVQRARVESGRMADELAQHATKNEAAYDRVGATLTGIGLAAGAGVGAAVLSFASFDQQMSAVQAATLATTDEMRDLRSAAEQAGADTAFSALEAAQGVEELAKAGIATSDIIGGGLTGALDLAAAGGLGVAEAAEIAASTMVQFGLKGNEVSRVADALAAGAGKAQGSVQDLGLALSYAGVPANALGLTVEETTGTLALFANAGITGEKAGTALRAMLVSLQNPSMKASETMSSLGIEVFDAQGNFVGMEAAAGVLQERLGGLTDEQRGAALATIFGNESLGAATTLYNGGAAGVDKWTKAVSESGYASEVAATRLNNLRGDYEAFTGSVETSLIRLGESGNGPLRELTQDATTMVNVFAGMPAGVQQGVTVIGAVTAAVGLASGATFLLIPRLVAANAALAAMGPAGARAAAGIGAAGRATLAFAPALAVLGAAGAVAVDSWVDQQQAIDDYAASLDGATGALTRQSRAITVKRLEDSGAFAAAQELGLSLDVVTRAAEGNADAMAQVAAATDAASEGTNLSAYRLLGLGDATQKAIPFVGDLRLSLGGSADAARLLSDEVLTTNEVLAAGQEQAQRAAEANGTLGMSADEARNKYFLLGGGIETVGVMAAQAADPSDELAAAVAGVGEEALTAEERIANLDKALDALLGAELGVQEATDATEQALADLADRAVDAEGVVETLSGGISDNTQAARDNRSAINDAMRAIAEEAATRAASGEGIGLITDRIYASREALIQEAMSRGASREEAEEYTASLLRIPGTVTSNIETPGMKKALEDAAFLKTSLENMPKTVKVSIESYTSSLRQDIAAARRGPQGDTDGAFRGTAIGYSGTALNRVQKVLPAGMRITSTYRSPAHNARVGGSPTSLHMDRNNPAVDIAGSTQQMDAFARQLRAIGGWRQLLWRVPGHFDHIHVAHRGGEVSDSWRRQPGDGPDERTARLQVGERVLSRSQYGSLKAAMASASYGMPAQMPYASTAGASGARPAITIPVTVDAGAPMAQHYAQVVADRTVARLEDAIATNGLAAIANGAHG